MGVFGTLRKGRGNSRLMGHAGAVKGSRFRHIYEEHHKAFMPHFSASGLRIYMTKDASAPFEIFTYTKVNWERMIPNVDALEGFHPSTGGFGYHRSLVWLHVLPKEFKHDLFDHVSFGDRNLELDTWDEYQKMPCWVYSSIRENSADKFDTVIWDGETVKKPHESLAEWLSNGA